MKNKNILADLFDLGKDDYDKLEEHGLAAAALRGNSYFLQAVAELKAEYVRKEDSATAEPTCSFDDKTKYREYYSLLRLLLDGLVLTLDSKIMMLENNKEN